MAENGFAKGRYTRIPVSRLDSARSESRDRQPADSKKSPDLDMLNPDILVAKGIEARGLGDLPKSAWLFMKAADAGSSTGRMYWGEPKRLPLPDQLTYRSGSATWMGRGEGRQKGLRGAEAGV